MNNRRRILILSALLGAAIGLFFVFKFYQVFFQSNTRFEQQTQAVYIKKNTDLQTLIRQLNPYLISTESFVLAAQKKGYATRIKSGKYELKKGSSNNDLINTLRSQSKTVKVRFNNQERLEDLAGRLAQQLAPDSLDFVMAFKDHDFLHDKPFDTFNALAMYLPNTYDFFWDTTAAEFCSRMWNEYQRFWNDERRAKADKIGLTPEQVIALAAVVQKETVKKDERKRVAGVYLNRINRGMKLQADPTVIYALKLKENNFDTLIKRVLYKDLNIQSPYNTYRYAGVPPGPITMPDLDAIAAVLDPEQHSFLYFVADPSNPGYHAFAKTLGAHNRNKRSYVKWINSQKIYR
ncbi:MAG: endolytic transglycosylase MltG [Bacteroidetes bacterium]|nr:endolytic transglycosylase MltG [Bacteroidota bacterium]MDA0937600.1 endolytic transglycosylase MltG [Bacteroidota bacterium]